MWHFCSGEKELRYVFNDFNSCYEELLSLSNRTTLYIEPLQSSLGSTCMCKSIMKTRTDVC